LLVEFSVTVLACLAPQGGGEPQTPQPLLTPDEQKSLRAKLSKVFDAKTDLDEGKDREKANKAYEKANDAFQKEWSSKNEKKGDLMRSMPDMLAIFDNLFTYPRPSFSLGQLRKEAPKDRLDWAVWLPKSYKPEVPIPGVLVLPSQLEKGGFETPAKCFEQLWDKTPATEHTVFHVVSVPKEYDLDSIPDFSRDGAYEAEANNVKAAFESLGETLRTFNIDRRRLVLDCGRGSSGFGLRLATYFPDRFAGLVLRHPVAIDRLRLGSLAGIPVLLLKSKETADACDRIKDALDELQKDACTVLEVGDAWPHKAAEPEIEKFIAACRRNLMRQRVVLEPNHDLFKRGFWVRINQMATIHAVGPDDRPRLEVTADRATNRIDVKARNIEAFSLQLNDALVDLDKEYTVVINGKAMTEKRARDFNKMFRRVREKFDGEHLFPVEFDCMVPKVEAKEAAAGDQAGSGK
jgi:hypothetical protein